MQMLICIHPAKVVYTFYRHNRDVSRFLNSDNTVSRATYFRVLALASIDILITLPFGITSLVLIVLSAAPSDVPFYPGSWDYVHSDWAPYNSSYAEMTSDSLSAGAVFFTQWTPPFLALVAFGLFGLTGEAIESYRDAFRTVLSCVRGLRTG